MSKTLSLYLHTHWDREWYWNFNAYRMALVPLVEQILHGLEEGCFQHFMLDGQTSLLEDVFAVKPELESRIADLTVQKKLSLGPWYVLADQLLVGGESLVRNLSLGLRQSQALGASLKVGYMPDTFGHSADLPTILHGFGIDSAVVWRGVPGLSSPYFLWESPAGAKVRTFHLRRGYYQTAFSENLSNEQLVKYLAAFLSQAVEDNNLNRHGLVPVGGDHMGPPPGRFSALLEQLSGFDHQGEAVKIKEESLSAFLERIGTEPPDIMPLVSGELRDNRKAFEHERAYMLDGVLSTRLYLKRANRLSEHRLFALVEPFLSAVCILQPGFRYPFAELTSLCKTLLANHPHDSICGCSADSVHQEMLSRDRSLHAGLDTLERRALEALQRPTPDKNPGQDSRADQAQLMQKDQSRPRAKYGLTEPLTLKPTEGKLPSLYSFCTSIGAAASLPRPVLVKFAFAKAQLAFLQKLGQVVAVQEKHEAFAEIGGVPDWQDVCLVEAWTYAGQSAPLAFSPLSFAADQIWPTSSEQSLLQENQDKCEGGLLLSNQYIEVYVGKESGNPLYVGVRDGATTRFRKVGHHIYDRGDGGDTYNFDPICGEGKGQKPLQATLKSVRSGFSGPLVSSLLLEYEAEIPEGLEVLGEWPVDKEPTFPKFKRSAKTLKHTFHCRVLLKAGLPIVFFETSFTNQSKQHRLEVVFDSPGCQGTISENHFSLIGRPEPLSAQLDFHKLESRAAELGAIATGHEAPLNRQPCQRFFFTDEAVYFNKGLPEYGLYKDLVSYTILRAVGKLSSRRLLTRGGGAGPDLDTPEANCFGEQIVEYGYAPFAALAKAFAEALPDKSDKSENINGKAALAYAGCELYEGRDLVLDVSSDSLAASAGSSLLQMDDPRLSLMSMHLDKDERGESFLILRVLNVTSETFKTDLTINFDCGPVYSCRLDLKQEKLLPADAKQNGNAGHCSSVSVGFERFQLRTLKIRLKN
ncbi:MAG: hypothetical protein K2Y32_08135 [Candidatus Obscuribacterales bacterium]|nr:hypothetical protein [Candidatus Obscuribacterales bacterium]